MESALRDFKELLEVKHFWNKIINSTFSLFPFAGSPDILICGNCREMFSDLVDMIEHKKYYCKLRFTCKCDITSDHDGFEKCVNGCGDSGGGGGGGAEQQQGLSAQQHETKSAWWMIAVVIKTTLRRLRKPFILNSLSYISLSTCNLQESTAKKKLWCIVWDRSTFPTTIAVGPSNLHVLYI